VERSRAVASVLALVPNTTPEAFDAWRDAFKSAPDDGRFFYGAHAAHVIRFNRSAAASMSHTMDTPKAAVELSQQILELPPEQLGGINDSFLCLRIDDSTGANSGRIVVLERGAVEAVLEQLFPNASLTPAEKRALLQVVCGVPLKQAAAGDATAYETKRRQIKSVSAKTGRGGQRDLAGFVLARLLVDLAWTPIASSVHDAALYDYHHRYLPSEVRVHVTERRDGTRHRLLDFGDRNGRVFIVLHSQVLPSLSTADVEFCSKLGLRLIWPLRHGELDPEASLLSFDDHASHARAGIDAARELFTGKRAVLLCLMSACWYGIDYAHRHPENVERLVFVGACYRPTRGKDAQGRLRDGLLRLSGQHRASAALLLRFIGQRLRDPERLDAFLRKLYTDSAPDTAVLAADLDDSEARESLMLRFTLSGSSITQDFLHLHFPNFNKLVAIDKPIAFVHGSEDPVHPVSEVASLAEQVGAPLTILKGAGQLLYAAHWSTVLSAAARATE